MDENLAAEVTQEEIFENIKLHKEVLSSVKMQPWNMRKKLKLVVQAKAYIKKHEGVLQERLAQSRSTKDMLARWNIYIIKKWQHLRREMANLSMWFLPWERKIKEIESHFGSVVASYFIFLRWLFWVNIVIAVVLISFVAIPEMLTADPQASAEHKFILPEEKYNATNFLTLWDFQGIFKYSPLFYGWYTNQDSYVRGYRLPFAYFVTGLVVYAYSFFATLRKMAENSRMSKLSEKDDECIFSWKLFTAWDYMIGNAETAHNRVASVVLGFKEALLEEAEKKRESRNWRVICFRVLVNTIVLGLLSFSAFAVVMVVKRSTEPESDSTVWRKNEITVVMSLITISFPMLFEALGFCEQYHPRKQLRLQLARIMVLNLLNLYSLIFALFDKINDMKLELQNFKNITQSSETNLLTGDYVTNATNDNSISNCFCAELNDDPMRITSLAAALITNITTKSYPKITQLITESIVELTSASSESTAQTIFNSSLMDDIITEIYYSNNDTSNSSSNDFMDFTDIFNSTPFNTVFNNITEFMNVSEFDANNTDAKSLFSDYLMYILSQVGDKIADLIRNTTDYYNNTDGFFENVTDFTTELTTYNITSSLFEDGRFEFELSTILNEITSNININNNYSLDMNSSNCSKLCSENTNIIQPAVSGLNYSTKARLRNLCWETMFGQELIKLTVMDLFLTIISTLAIDFFRGLFVRYVNKCWCWDLEKKWPQYGDFKVAENILHLVNNQGMVWMGMFFSPGLVVLNVIKLYIMMYFRAWAVLTCNVPHEIIFRASRSNNFYYALLLMMLFLCVLPVGYAIVWIKPSWHCGPFSKHERIFHIFTKTIRNTVPLSMQRALDYIASPGIVIPLLVLLILIIYYLVSLTGALREANDDLKIQLRRERTEERRKMFQMADRRRRVGSTGSGDLSNTPMVKWKKLLSNLPSGRSLDDTPKQESEELPPSVKEDKVENKNKDFFYKFIKKALGKSSTSEDDQNVEDATDTEQHDSLPDDTKEKEKPSHKPLKPSISSTSSEFQASVGRAWTHKYRQKHKQPSPIEPIDFKHVQIKEDKPQKQVPPARNRRDTFDLKRTSQIRRCERPSTSKIFREDSASSNWSDNIPVIKISKTESSENILDEDHQKTTVKSVRHTFTEGITIHTKGKCFKENKDTKTIPKVKCALKKQSTEIDEDTICYFNDDLERKNLQSSLIQSVVEEDLKDTRKPPLVDKRDLELGFEEDDGISIKEDMDDLTDREGKSEKSSADDKTDDTDFKESSEDTILNAPYAIQKSLSEDSNKTQVDQKSPSTSQSHTESMSDYGDTNLS